MVMSCYANDDGRFPRDEMFTANQSLLAHIQNQNRLAHRAFRGQVCNLDDVDLVSEIKKSKLLELRLPDLRNQLIKIT